MTYPNRNAYLTAVFENLVNGLQYPVGKDGSVIQTTPVLYGAAWHLTRYGVRLPHYMESVPEWDAPIIKKRRVYGPGVYEDAVTWVAFDEPDDPLERLADMTMADIMALPDEVQVEAKRRLGLLPQPEQSDPTPAWSVTPYITITDAPDETTEWSN